MERRVQQHQIKRAADVCQKRQSLRLADVALAVNARRFAVGLYDGQCIRRTVDKNAAFCPAGQRLDAQLAAACKQVQHTGAGHQKLHAGEHGLLNTVDSRAGDILARQCLQVFTPGGTGNYTHGHAPLF